MDINVNITFGGEALAAINAALATLLKRTKNMSQQLDSLIAQVAATKTIEESAIALLVGLKAKLDDAIASGDPAQLQALSDALAADNAALADAITANTPTP